METKADGTEVKQEVLRKEGRKRIKLECDEGG